MRVRAAAGGLLLALAALPATAGTARFPAQRLEGGGLLPARASASGDPSDAAASRRRAEILRSPYFQIGQVKPLRGGDLALGFERGVPLDTRERIEAALLAVSSALDRDGWARVGSARGPLQVLVTAQRGALAAAGWEGRDAGLLARPVVVVSAADPAAALLDAGHQLALLALRQTAPDAADWAVEGTAEFLARRALGVTAEPVTEDDAFLAESGALTEPHLLADFLPLLVRRLPRGVAELRAAWEDAGTRRGDESEAMLRALAARGDRRGIAGLLGDLLVRRLARAAMDDAMPGPRRPLPPGGVAAAAPSPLGFRRVALRTADEGGGLEIVLPEGARVATGRALLGYRRDGGFDAADLLPGVPRRVPLSGVARVGLILVDGGEPGDVFVELRRLHDYPAALLGFSAEWDGAAVRLSWRTARHGDLLAWIVSRTDETEGERESDSRIVPTSESDDDGFAYQLDDARARPGHRYRYRVLALTTEGFLSEAFEASVLAGR